ncbi:MAG: DUF4097 family beta strand repeat protein [Chloroflexota bacterium]|nr:DUF4097 family beta strand repeat protein [Chloroflexota bacterium]
MEHVRHVSREFPTGGRAVLHLESRSGAVIVEGRALDRVQVDAEVRTWSVSSDDADAAARAVADGMEQDGSDRVIVRAPALPETAGGWSLLKLGQRGSRVDYRVRVPVTSSVRVLSRSGRVEIAGVHGRVHSEVLSGRCRVRDIEGETAVIARSGAVEVERVRGSVTAEAKSGRIRVAEVAGPVTVDSRSGAVELTRVEGDLRVNVRTGAVTIGDAGGAVYVRSRCGMVRYRGAVRGDFDIEVGTGPITLAVDPEKPFFIDAESRVGPVVSDLPPRRRGEAPAAGGPKVRLRTQTGPIRLTRAD